ncbi:hypothetical protein GC175_04035 [bacterium]|nr:hypothetical protein [bacterium]
MEARRRRWFVSYLEIQQVTILLLYSLWLLAPWHADIPGTAYMTLYAPVWVWGTLGAVMAVSWVMGWVWRLLGSRVMAVNFGGTWWSYIAASALVSEWRDPTFLVYAAMAVGHLVVYHAILEV